jgi:uncharacterized protein YjbJ (UPF0337 family)
MNDDTLRGQWKQVRGKAKEWWGKLTDDDLDVIDGKRDQLIGKLQERYGYSRDEAAQEVNMRLKEMDRQTDVNRRV